MMTTQQDLPVKAPSEVSEVPVTTTSPTTSTSSVTPGSG